MKGTITLTTYIEMQTTIVASIIAGNNKLLFGQDSWALDTGIQHSRIVENACDIADQIIATNQLSIDWSSSQKQWTEPNVQWNAE